MPYKIEVTEKAVDDLASLFAPDPVPRSTLDCVRKELTLLAADPIEQGTRPIFPQPGGGQMFYFSCRNGDRRDFAALFIYGDDEETLYILRFMRFRDAMFQPE
jgi:hypothetical protein